MYDCTQSIPEVILALIVVSSVTAAAGVIARQHVPAWSFVAAALTVAGGFAAAVRIRRWERARPEWRDRRLVDSPAMLVAAVAVMVAPMLMAWGASTLV